MVIVVRRVVDILHVAVVQLEDAEADVQVLRGQRVLFLDFLPSAADALLADFADVLGSRPCRASLCSSQGSGSCTIMNLRRPPSSALSCMTAWAVVAEP